jgi:hypothetical protein
LLRVLWREEPIIVLSGEGPFDVMAGATQDLLGDSLQCHLFGSLFRRNVYACPWVKRWGDGGGNGGFFGSGTFSSAPDPVDWLVCGRWSEVGGGIMVSVR